MAEGIGQEDITVVPNINCELCEEGDINWKCLTCNEYLCHQCRRTHLKSKASCNHIVTAIKGFENQQQYKKEEKGDLYCTTHQKEVIIMYCEQCDLPICRDCISSGSHQYHTLTKIENTIDDKRKELSQVIKEAGQHLSALQGDVHSIKQNRVQYSRGTDNRIDEVKSRNIQLKATLDQITNNVIARLKQEEYKNQETLKEKEKEIESRISSVKELITRCKRKQIGSRRSPLKELITRFTRKQVKRDKDLVRFVTDAKQELEEYQMHDRPDPIIPPDFLTKDLDVEKLKVIFGDLDLEDEKGSDYM